MRRKIVRIWANRETCLSHEACQITLAFKMREGRVAVANDADRYFESDRQWIIDAVMSCPTASLFIEFDDGLIISSRDYDRSKGLEQLLEF
jgi:ferredoxin